MGFCIYHGDYIFSVYEVEELTRDNATHADVNIAIPGPLGIDLGRSMPFIDAIDANINMGTINPIPEFVISLDLIPEVVPIASHPDMKAIPPIIIGIPDILLSIMRRRTIADIHTIIAERLIILLRVESLVMFSLNDLYIKYHPEVNNPIEIGIGAPVFMATTADVMRAPPESPLVRDFLSNFMVVVLDMII